MGIGHFAAGANGTGGHERLLTVSAHVKFHRCYLLGVFPTPNQEEPVPADGPPSISGAKSCILDSNFHSESKVHPQALRAYRINEITLLEPCEFK
jgi:hypothetical protein